MAKPIAIIHPSKDRERLENLRSALLALRVPLLLVGLLLLQISFNIVTVFSP